MAHVKHERIQGRADFFSELDWLIAGTRAFHAQDKNASADALWIPLERQLDALKGWTDNGRQPTKDERKSITAGRTLVREFQDAPAEYQEWVSRFLELVFYFKHWKSDADWQAMDDRDWKRVFPDEYAP